MHVRAWAQEVATLRPHLLRPHPIRPHLLLDVVNGVAGGLDDALFAVLASALGLLDVCLLLGRGGSALLSHSQQGLGWGSASMRSLSLLSLCVSRTCGNLEGNDVAVGVLPEGCTGPPLSTYATISCIY